MQMGMFGGPHMDDADSAGRFTHMIQNSSCPNDYDTGVFYIFNSGIKVRLETHDGFNFSGLNFHGASPLIAPPGQEVNPGAIRITNISYPPAGMVDGAGHYIFAAMPKLLSRTALPYFKLS